MELWMTQGSLAFTFVEPNLLGLVHPLGQALPNGRPRSRFGLVFHAKGPQKLHLTRSVSEVFTTRWAKPLWHDAFQQMADSPWRVASAGSPDGCRLKPENTSAVCKRK
jgi:hypothetical protein